MTNGNLRFEISNSGFTGSGLDIFDSATIFTQEK
jgi:hypothetical protein